MNSNEILKADLLDILFEGRNKQYGAYTLRKYYNSRMIMSMGIALSGVLLILLLIGSLGSYTSKPLEPAPPEMNIISVVLPPDPEPIVPPPSVRPPAVPSVAQQAFTDQYTLVDRTPVISMLPQDLIINVSDVSANGSLISSPYVAPGPPSNQVPDEAMQPIQPVEPPLQREPEFPGGLKAWLAFLQNNLQVPSSLEAGEKKTVLIRFQVGADGRVTGFEVAQSGGRLYDNEVIRVLKRMPKWKPAIQNNIPVARSFTQPVTFMGVEE
ncbi:MAG: energy transducer TonB [Flavisolibacter sp.]